MTGRQEKGKEVETKKTKTNKVRKGRRTKYHQPRTRRHDIIE
jgi:hypothetical protein